MADRDPRYRGLRPNPDALGVELLREGEQTRTVRVRGAAEVLDWAAGLSAAQRGEILAQAYAAHRSAQEDLGADQMGGPSEYVEQRVSEPQGSMGRAAPLTPGADLLLVKLKTPADPARLTAAQCRVTEAVAAGAQLYRRGQAGPYVLVMPDGEERVAHSGTVRALLRGT